MRAIAFTRVLPTDPAALVDIEIDRPEPGPNDLLVKVEAVSVNPVDFKVRANADTAGKPRLLGFDAAGTVVSTGPKAIRFKPGDAVYYAGSIMRQGTNGEYHVVDERIVGRKPATLDFAEAAALPLTTLTFWELLFDRIGVKRGPDADKRSLLIVSGAGGVGSIAIQLARVLTGLTVIATASRPESLDWVRRLGAHHVINHGKPLAPQLAELGFESIDIAAPLGGTKDHMAAIVELMAPEGHIGVVEGSGGLGAVEFGKLDQKSIGLHFESMFTRSRFGLPDIVRQHEILETVADLVDAGKIRTTLTRRLKPISAATLTEAHAALMTGRTIGKIVIEGWKE